MNFPERLSYAIKKTGLTQAALAKRMTQEPGCEAFKQSNVSKLLGRGTEGTKFAPQLAKVLEVDSYWLATGKGNPDGPRLSDTLDTLFSSPETVRLVKAIKQLDRQGEMSKELSTTLYNLLNQTTGVCIEIPELTSAQRAFYDQNSEQ